MASKGATLLGIDDGDDDNTATTPVQTPANKKEFQRALEMLGIKDVSELPPIPQTAADPTRKRVIIRPPSTRDKLPEPVKSAAGYADQFTEGVPILTPLADKAAAAIAATAQGVGQGNPNPYGDNWLDRYNSGLDKSRKTTKDFAAENPIGSTVANVAGGVTSAVPLAMTGPGALAMGLRGPSLGWRTLASTLGGAGMGGADAALRGEDAGTGAMIGGGVGLIAPGMGELASKGTSVALNHFFPPQGALKGVDSVNVNRLVGAIQGETPQTVADSSARLGPNGFLGEVTPGLTDLTGAAAVTPGPGKAAVNEAYRTRLGEQRPRIEAAADAAAGPRRDMVELEHLTTEAQKIAASPLYNQWTSMKVPPSTDLKNMIPRLKAAGAFSRAEKLAAISGEPVNIKYFTGGPQKEFPTAQTWDYVKQGLDSKIDAAYAAGHGLVARKLISLKNDMIKEISKTDAGQVWDKARGTFADYASIKDNHAAGYDTFLGGRSGLTVDELKHELQGLSTPEVQARIVGARAAISDAMGATLQGDSKLRNMLLAPNNKEKLKLLLGPKAGPMIKALEEEHLLAEHYVNVIGNPSTGASNVGRSERKNMLMPEPAREWGLDLQKPGTWVPPSIRDQFTISGMINARRGDRYSAANNQLAQILTRPNDPKTLAILDALRNESARQARIGGRAQAGGNLLTGAVSGPAASVVRRQSAPSQ